MRDKDGKKKKQKDAGCCSLTLDSLFSGPSWCLLDVRRVEPGGNKKKSRGEGLESGKGYQGLSS